MAPTVVRLRYGLIAGLVGRGLNALLSVILLPLYLAFMGVEAVGLIGIYTTMLTFFLLIDQILSVIVIRETARLRSTSSNCESVRGLLASSELIYLGVCVPIIGFLCIVFPFTSIWASTEALESSTFCLLIAAFTIPAQLLVNLHVSILIGLERQILANVIVVSLGLCRGALALGALLLFWRTADVYFSAQFIATTIMLFFSSWFVRRHTVRPEHLDVQPLRLLKDNFAFTSGVALNAIAFVVITQSDKLMVSFLLPLTAFGYYILAATISSLPSVCVTPILSVLLPRFSFLLGAGGERIRPLYHLSSQFTALLILPAWSIVFYFPDAVVTMWTQLPSTAISVSPILTLLFSGAVLICLNTVPNALALATGHSRFALFANLVAFSALPTGFFLIRTYGVVGASSVWLIVGIFNVVLLPILIHRTIFPGTNVSWRWYFIDNGLPFVAVNAAALAYRSVTVFSTAWLPMATQILLAWCFATIAAIFAAPAIRRQIWVIVGKRFLGGSPKG